VCLTPAGQDFATAAPDGLARGPRLPLLPFHNGYASVYTAASPALRRYRAPALVAVVGRWLVAGARQRPGALRRRLRIGLALLLSALPWGWPRHPGDERSGPQLLLPGGTSPGRSS